MRGHLGRSTHDHCAQGDLQRGLIQNQSMGRTTKRPYQQGDTLTPSLVGLAVIFVACAVWWSVAPQWLTSTWQIF